jgi:hypothetical protein
LSASRQLVAHNARFIRRVMQKGAVRRVPGRAAALPWIDLAWVLPDLFREFGDENSRLDVWLEHFGHREHQAPQRAFRTPTRRQTVAGAIARAARNGFDTPASLIELEKARRHLHQSG